MIYGITDIGTNTIRAVVYKKCDDIKVLNELVFESEILINTVDKNLTDDGIEKLVSVLNASVQFFLKNKVDKIHFFATSAMRDIENFSKVNEKVFDECHTKIELLDEKTEILCDFYGVKLTLSENLTGQAIDLGGGSCQIISFENGEMTGGKSLKIGVKRLYKMFGGTSVNELKCYINSELDKAKIKECENLYIMGGTSKNILATLKILNPQINNSFDAEKLEEVKKVDFFDEKFFKIYENRVNTIEYGIEVISEIVKRCKAKTLTVIKSDARKGYIILKEGK